MNAHVSCWKSHLYIWQASNNNVIKENFAYGEIKEQSFINDLFLSIDLYSIFDTITDVLHVISRDSFAQCNINWTSRKCISRYLLQNYVHFIQSQCIEVNWEHNSPDWSTDTTSQFLTPFHIIIFQNGIGLKHGRDYLIKLPSPVVDVESLKICNAAMQLYVNELVIIDPWNCLIPPPPQPLNQCQPEAIQNKPECLW